MNYTPAPAPTKADFVPAYLERELQRIAAAIADTAPRLWFLQSLLTPAQLTGATNDYAPAGLNGAAWVRLSASTPLNLSGLKNPQAATPRMLFLSNVSASTITLLHASGLSAAANRFNLPGAANLALTQNMGVMLAYDIKSSVWRSLS